MHKYYRPKMKLLEGNVYYPCSEASEGYVFTGICLITGGEGVTSNASWDRSHGHPIIQCHTPLVTPGHTTPQSHLITPPSWSHHPPLVTPGHTTPSPGHTWSHQPSPEYTWSHQPSSWTHLVTPAPWSQHPLVTPGHSTHPLVEPGHTDPPLDTPGHTSPSGHTTP